MTTASFTFNVPEPRRGSVQREVEARKARHRLYPVSILYSVYALTLLLLALRESTRLVSLAFFALGGVVWTAVEYWAHRYILHGRFPDGPGSFEHFCHRFFDHLHLEHHQRPWDGNHVNGTIKDTLPFVLVLVAGSYLFPWHTAPLLIAGVIQAYIVEEWIHHSVHFCSFKAHYFQYIKRHHLYHHSPRGSNVGYGLTNGFWDVVWDTRIPEAERKALYSKL
jgi:sterol desaturase/sphingolipid hydroxylase (fatty acid hydroxylase superfamily)